MDEEVCEVCWGPIRVMAFKKTGVCCGKCEKAREARKEAVPVSTSTEGPEGRW